MLTLDKVQVSIEGVRVLRDVSCDIVERKTTVLIGRNGAGKTTTLRAIMGLISLDSGAIRLDREGLANFPPITAPGPGLATRLRTAGWLRISALKRTSFCRDWR